MTTKRTILLVYLGNEQGSWGNISFSRPWHYYIMPGILSCAHALQADAGISLRCDIICRHFNRTVQSLDSIADELLKLAPDLIGFSSYCWNIADNLELARRLKNSHQDVRILFGGPEVFMNDDSESNRFFTANAFADCLAFGESERKISTLVRTLLFGEQDGLPQITGFAFAPRWSLTANYTVEYVTDHSAIPSAYPFTIDIPRSKNCGLAMVYETGRGCPYRCIYCQFGRRNHKPFRFDIQRVQRELTWLFEQRIDCIHFADAVFDLDPAYAKDILRFIITRNISSSLFFYCSFYRLDEELASLFSQSQCQIGVGIQSTNPVVLHTIRRALSPRLFDDISGILKNYPLNFYTDLIFGLPADNPLSFARSFEQTLNLQPTFVMPFPLTLIKGTPLGDTADEYGVRRYGATDVEELGLMCDIQYSNIALYKDFTLADLSRLDDAALALFYFYNRFPHSLRYLQQRSSRGYFDLFAEIGSRTKTFLRRIGRTASNTDSIEGFEDEILSIFSAVVDEVHPGETERLAFNELYKLDIFRILILGSPAREKIFANALRFQKKDGMRTSLPAQPDSVVATTFGKIISVPYRYDDLSRLAHLQNNIKSSQESVYVHAPFSHWNASFVPVSPVERFLIEFIPTDRPVRTERVVQAALRHFTHRGEQFAIDEKKMQEAISSLATQGIITFLAKETV